MSIRTIAFDFGKVVGFFDHRRAIDRLAAYTPLSADEVYAYVIGGELEDAYESGRITTPDFLRQVRQACRYRCSEEVLGATLADVFWPNPDVCALVPRLKLRYRLLLGSNTNELHARHFCRQFADTFRHFDHLVFSHEIGARKPRAPFFQHCLKLAGCRPEECLFIDDLPENVAGARACGWRGIVYAGFKELTGQLAEWDIDVG
jgi:putative hydrolase of the HAD superfamily